MSTPPKAGDHLVECRLDAGGIGDVAGHRQRLAADLFRRRLGSVRIAVQDRHFRALGGHGPGRRRPDAGTAAGDHRHLPGQHFFVRLAQLGLFQRPIFDFEHVEFADAFVFADRLGVGDHRDGVFGDVGGDGRILGGGAHPEHAHPRHQDHARQRIQFFFLHRALGVVAGEIIVIAGDEGIGCGPHLARPFSQFALLGRRHDHRPVLGADGVIGGHHPLLAVAGKLRPIDVIQDFFVAAEIQDLPLGGACRRILLDGDGAAQDGRDLRHRGEIGGELGLHQRFALPRQPLLRQGDEFDHPAIGLFRRRAHGEDAVLEQHQTFHIRVAVEHIGHRFGQGEAGDGVGHIRHPVAEHLARHRLAVRLVGERQHGGGMGVIDEFVRQEGVQQSLDRGIGRGGIQQIDALEIHHVLVRQFGQRP